MKGIRNRRGPPPVPRRPRLAAAALGSALWIGACYATIHGLRVDVRTFGVMFPLGFVYLLVASFIGWRVAEEVQEDAVFWPGLAGGMLLGLIAAVLWGGLIFNKVYDVVWQKWGVEWRPSGELATAWCAMGSFVLGTFFSNRRTWRRRAPGVGV